MITILLIASVLTILVFSLCYKIAAVRRCNLNMVNVWMYFGAAVCVAIYALADQRLSVNRQAIDLGILTGIGMFVATLSFFYHIRTGKLSASWTVINLSVAFPVLAGLVIWHEQPSPRQVVGLILIALSLLLFGRRAAMDGGEE